MTLRIRTLGFLWSASAFFAGVAAAWMWLASSQAWNAHLTRAYLAGFALYSSLTEGSSTPEGLQIFALPPEKAALAETGAFARLRPEFKPAYVTNASILAESVDVTTGRVLRLGIVSPDLRYQVSALPQGENRSPPQKLGALAQLLATYCSDPVLYARLGDEPWKRVEGAAIWGCAAAPADHRLPAVLLAVFALMVIFTQVAETSSSFDRFSQALRIRRRLGGPESYTSEGPEELRDIVSAVNSYLESEREQLSKRAVVLSGVSHDLGTPATRLRLRSALIQDVELREKLEADIDAMTKMIESVLTYTRSELNIEEPRQLSLTALIESLVEDYQDTGKPVTFQRLAPTVVTGGSSVFMSRSGHSQVPDERRILVVARPISLQRALSNLIDNALKYGRRATVELEAGADSAIITVEDEGSELSVAQIEEVLSPFRRGPNTQSVDGFGLGLTIVATVAEQHGGSLSFETGAHGLRARLKIQRS